MGSRPFCSEDDVIEQIGICHDLIVVFCRPQGGPNFLTEFYSMGRQFQKPALWTKPLGYTHKRVEVEYEFPKPALRAKTAMLHA
jgi:hypothetical protein